MKKEKESLVLANEAHLRLDQAIQTQGTPPDVAGLRLHGENAAIAPR
ncbi:hypothetical protein SAMN04487976_10962 [Xaviernesmea oryzae]|nr:hypothetical protein SAMN04487976_10962 [Xaviernesmea oryzae]